MKLWLECLSELVQPLQTSIGQGVAMCRSKVGGCVVVFVSSSLESSNGRTFVR